MSPSSGLNALSSPSWMNPFRYFGGQSSTSTELDETARLLRAIRDQSTLYRQLSDEELSRISTSNSMQADFDDVIRITMAAGVEATRRVMKIDLYDCQLRAAIELYRGSIVQLQTGEGKTLVAMLAATCFAFSGRSPHVMTMNSYLARRDREQLAPIYRALGLTVGLTDTGLSIEEKQRGYRSHIVYGPGYEFGFDYLRDQLAILSRPRPKLGENVLKRWRQPSSSPSSSSTEVSIQRGLTVAIVDEADSVMLDEASTPLILSSGQKTPAENAYVYRFAHTVAQQLRGGQDYQFSQKEASFQWTDVGLITIGQPPTAIRSGLERAWQHYLQQAIYASHRLHRDVHYLVDDGRVQLIDQHTGRIQADRSWGAGLQQAVEAKEGLTITAENQALATITRQRFLCAYKNLCGLTGTATGSEREIQEVYRLPVSEILPNRPSQLQTVRPQMLLDKRLHEEAIIASVKACQERRQPVMVGTTSIQSSERLAVAFIKAGIAHRLLSGRQDADEAAIIAIAGNACAVTIATNIAGRGTDIRLGPGVAESGGLHVIATELHESQRVERQLMGRAGRQGSPGSFELILSTEDPLLARCAPSLALRLRDAIIANRLNHSDWVRELRELQNQLELQRTEERRKLFAIDDWHHSMLRDM
jgi:preprotein translocase subunit SecA